MHDYRNEKIEQVLNSLDGVEQAQVSHFFYTRLKVRMEKKLLQQSGGFIATRPVFILSALLLLLVVNITVLLPGKEYNNKGQAQTINEEANLETFMSAYNIQTQDETNY